MGQPNVSPLAIKPVLNRFHKTLPPPESSAYQVREWLNTWLGRESRTMRNALHNINWDAKQIRELTKEAMAYEIDKGIRSKGYSFGLFTRFRVAELNRLGNFPRMGRPDGDCCWTCHRYPIGKR